MRLRAEYLVPDDPVLDTRSPRHQRHHRYIPASLKSIPSDEADVAEDDVPPRPPAHSDPAPEVDNTDIDDPDRTLVEEPAVKTESKPDIKPSILKSADGTSTKKRRRTMTERAVLPAHGSADRPFRIDNEDSVSSCHWYTCWLGLG